jgi:hypothetical protein
MFVDDDGEDGEPSIQEININTHIVKRAILRVRYIQYCTDAMSQWNMCVYRTSLRLATFASWLPTATSKQSYLESPDIFAGILKLK